MPLFSTVACLTALAAAPLVSAHGWVQNVTANGKTYTGVGDPVWAYWSSGKPQVAGWYALNQDSGFVSPSAFGTSDIACHKSATPGATQIDVTAGSTITVTWTKWPDTHHGPIISYLAKTSGSFTSASAGDLNFFKIDQLGLTDTNYGTGNWATDKLIAANGNWDIKIPSNIAPGSYVLRHEIFGLHSAYNENGAQAYPSCINLNIASSGSSNPTGVKGSSLYKSTDPGILINIYNTITNYVIPGPAVAAKREAVSFEA